MNFNPPNLLRTFAVSCLKAIIRAFYVLMAVLMKERIIRALYDENTITVYQAYNKSIAQEGLKAQTFVSPPFKIQRMTWIKPSFLWMMYRSGWATKEYQDNILSIKMTRDGFERALNNACLSHFDKSLYLSEATWREKLKTSFVRIQWDPEKDILLNELPYRSIQIGLSGKAVEEYLSKWIIQIDDITESCKDIRQLIIDKKINKAKNLLPIEKTYPLPKILLQ